MFSISRNSVAGQWRFYANPFPHIVAEGVFERPLFSDLSADFRRMLAMGLSEQPSLERFSRMFAGYDAYGAKLPKVYTNPLSIFATRDWHDLLSRTMRSGPLTGDINIELHHHRAGSANGKVHNDLNPGWFVGRAGDASVNLSDSSICNYQTGSCADPALNPRRTTRAVAMIYYLANNEWREGDGGETALYAHRTADVKLFSKRVKPIDNSMIVFECSPFSFHAFLRNTRIDRNAVVMWLHRDPLEIQRKWGNNVIVEWKAGKENKAR